MPRRRLARSDLATWTALVGLLALGHGFCHKATQLSCSAQRLPIAIVVIAVVLLLSMRLFHVGVKQRCGISRYAGHQSWRCLYGTYRMYTYLPPYHFLAPPTASAQIDGEHRPLEPHCNARHSEPIVETPINQQHRKRGSGRTGGSLPQVQPWERHQPSTPSSRPASRSAPARAPSTTPRRSRRSIPMIYQLPKKRAKRPR